MARKKEENKKENMRFLTVGTIIGGNFTSKGVWIEIEKANAKVDEEATTKRFIANEDLHGQLVRPDFSNCDTIEEYESLYDNQLVAYIGYGIKILQDGNYNIKDLEIIK